MYPSPRIDSTIILILSLFFHKFFLQIYASFFLIMEILFFKNLYLFVIILAKSI